VRQECRDAEHTPLFFRSDWSALACPLAGVDQLVEGATLSARLDEESANYSRVFDIKISTPKLLADRVVATEEAAN
jgi:hypothetical protein